MAVSDKFSCSCGRSPKQKPVLSEGFVNYLQTDSRNYRELMNLKRREYNYSFVSRTHWTEGVSILASTHKPEDTRMWECENTNKLTFMKLRIWRCEDARIQASTHEPEDMRMQGCKQEHTSLKIQGCKDAGIQAITHKHKGMSMRRYKQVRSNLRIWGCKDINKSNISNM